MPNERVVEVPWALQHLPQKGVILDVGSCEATYLHVIQQYDRELHCLDARDCGSELPQGATFHHQSLIGNTRPRACYDAVLILSTIEHIGLPWYGQQPFPEGDRMAIAEAARLLKPGGVLVVTVPAGRSKVAGWYRQYSPRDLRALFEGWRTTIEYFGVVDDEYVRVTESDVERFDYRVGYGAGAIACIRASLNYHHPPALTPSE